MTAASEESIEDLLGGDVAAWVAGSLKRDMNHELRLNGKRPPTFAEAVLAALAAAAGQPPAVAASGIAPVSFIGTSWVSVHEAAALAGRSERRIRQLASAGNIRSQRFGRVWQIDPDSLTNVLRRTA
jgi:hypothetical protein